MTGLALPLAVRIESGALAKRVTRHVRSVAFSAVDPGGYEAADIILDRAIDQPFPEVERFGHMTIEDTRSGEIVFDGEMTDPGREASSDGQTWAVKAVGGAGRTNDNESPLGYISRQIDKGLKYGARSATVEVIDESDEPKFRIFVPRGVVAGTTYEAGMLFPLYADLGQGLAQFDFAWDAGVTDANWRLQAITLPSGTVARDHALNTAGGGANARYVVTHFPDGDNRVLIQLARQTSSVTVANDVTSVTVSGFSAKMKRFDATGAVLTSGYNTALTDSQVVADLVGRRHAAEYAAEIAAAAETFTQLEWLDGATSSRVLAELAEQSGRTWAVWERGTDGRWRMVYDDKPTAVRYECDTFGGFTSPGSVADLWDRVRVRYRNSGGRLRSFRVDNTVPMLGDRHRTKLLDLGDDMGTVTDGTLAAQAFLAEHSTPPNAGTLTVVEPVFDRVRNAYVEPWLLRPGELYLTRDVESRGDVLNPDGRDGVTIFRGRRVAVGEDGFATVDLDASPTRMSERIARLQRELAERRRR
jgi:hypothetical protein